MSERFDHKKIEKKWQTRWTESKIYKTKEDPTKPKTYVLDMFPYPSGEGLHVGHPKGYIATDIYSRMKRMQGHNVLHPMGWDAFGLPAENYAIKNKVHPRVAVEKNIATFKEQLAGIGFDYDWGREINTTDPEYYKWTQWIFLQLYKKGLAYQSNEPINWCPSCLTGLANEDLDGNECERCGSVVEKKRLPQWVLRITDYADRMLEDLSTLQWPEHIKTAQRNWIGKSEGAEISFELFFKKTPKANDNRGPQGEKAQLTVFTTRPDTLFGATYLVLAPEHPWVTLSINQAHDVLENKEDVRKYVAEAAKKTEIERGENKEKTGVELKGVVAFNPATKEEIPLFVADYVLGGYGTGAIMAVPAHDERDFAFAKKFDLPITPVVMPHLIDAGNPPREGKKTIERRIILAIVYDPKQKKYLILSWKEWSWKTFVTGGIEKEEDPIEGARREIAEETGYTNIRFVRTIGFDTWTEFFAGHKDENRKAQCSILLFELENELQQEIALEEKNQHVAGWASMEELEGNAMRHAEIPYILEFLKKGESLTYTGPGLLTNSGQFDGLSTEEAKSKIVDFVGGKMTSTYKLKDWVFSRQRYWGEPIPIIHCPKDGAVGVPESQLPVLLPEVSSYEPSGTGESPLATITDWVNTTCPTCSGPAKRETNTMPQWAGSSWYYLRFMDPGNNSHLVDPVKEKFWAPVDVYVGGDHAVRHLIYARFWHKFLYDINVVSTIEPFARLEFLGFILAEDGRKMSKRYGNVINPTEVVANYGADAFRVYEMFMGPFENTVAWSTASIAGTTRFIERIWRIGISDTLRAEDLPSLNVLLHQTIKKVSRDIEAFKFNTAVSQLMIFLNAIEKEGGIGTNQWKLFLQLLAPFTPHTTEELWERLDHKESIHTSPWPLFEESKLRSDNAVTAVQINGKVRGTLCVYAGTPQEEVVEMAHKDIKIAPWLQGVLVQKVIYIPGKIINFVGIPEKG